MSPQRKLVLPQLPQLPERVKLVEARVNKGIVSSIHAVDIENAALTVALNARCRYDVTGRRPGRVLLTPAKPNSTKVLKVFLFKANDGVTHLFRFTKSSIHERGAIAWTAYAAGTGGALTGGDDNRFQPVVVLNKAFFANGVDKVQNLDTVAGTYKEAGPNAPKVKYLTGFYNRLVGGYRVEPAQPNGPVSLVWCADGDTTKWPDDAPADVSTGQSPLVDSPSDLADFITGVFGLTNVLLVIREKSIWVGTKQPIASNPFNFYTAVPGVGSDCPYGSFVIPGGLAFIDTLSSTVWAYQLDGGIQRIGESIEKDLFRAISEPKNVFGSYDPINSEGSWAIPLSGTSVLRTWTFNFRTKAWVYDEVDLLASINDIDSSFEGVLSFDELIGTFDQLVGSFDSLVNTQPASSPARYYGYTDGEILQELDTVDEDNGVPFTMDLQSKEFSAPTVDAYFCEIRVQFISKLAGTLALHYSRDHGKTWILAKSMAMVPDEDSILRYTRMIKSRSLRWRILASDGAPNILSYEVHIQPSGPSRT